MEHEMYVVTLGSHIFTGPGEGARPPDPPLLRLNQSLENEKNSKHFELPVLSQKYIKSQILLLTENIKEVNRDLCCSECL